jgi:biopolymer transport protein ExbB/TolQ
MKIKDFVLRFLITFGIGLIAAIFVTICWNYFIKKNGLIVDWETSFRTALILAIVIPLTQIKSK